jgi:hypothetical protein
MDAIKTIENPFRPGAGHMPPYLAGRESESLEFTELLRQDVILKNVVLTGLRGVGKTVLLETFKPAAMGAGWFWAGTDLSESTSVTEEHIATRIITDLSVATAAITLTEQVRQKFLQQIAGTVQKSLDYRVLSMVYEQTPGLVADKLKAVLEFAWTHINQVQKRGVVFAYDEAQNLADHAGKEQYPLSLLLDVFQSIQRKGVRFMLVMTGLPTLFPKLVEARTYTERMFHVITLGPLNKEETKMAVEEPIKKKKCPFGIQAESIDDIWEMTKGYPYLVQYVCRELFDIWVQQHANGEALKGVPLGDIIRKLDADFFAGRWARATDRQRELLTVIAWLENSDTEFTVQEIVDKSMQIFPTRSFSNSHANQMLVALSERGLVYKNRHGKYSFAVPLLNKFILRQIYSSVSVTTQVSE